MLSWILNNIVAFIIATASSCIAVRYIVPKKNPVMCKLQNSKQYGLFIQPRDYSEETLSEIRSILHKSHCTADRVSEDFGNGISYLGVSGLPTDYGFHGVQDSLMWYSNLCVNTFLTKKGEKYDKRLYKQKERERRNDPGEEEML